MILDNICAPAVLYICFSLTHIIIDLFKTLYNTAFFKFIVMIIFSLMLNVLCENGLGVVSWIIVFVPFLLMTVITTLLLFMFGLSPTTGKLNYEVDYPGKEYEHHREKRRGRDRKRIDQYDDNIGDDENEITNYLNSSNYHNNILGIKTSDEEEKSHHHHHKQRTKHKDRKQKKCPKGCEEPTIITGNCSEGIYKDSSERMFKECPWECPNPGLGDNKSCEYDQSCSECGTKKIYI